MSKKNLYLVRHGMTMFNERGIYQGHCDSPLTEAGIAQAQSRRAYFQKHGIHFDAAFCSTSERAVDTLELLCELPYTRRKDLREWNFGHYEGESIRLCPPRPYGEYFLYYQGEAEVQVRDRILRACLEIAYTLQGEHALIVSHGAALRLLLNFLSPSQKEEIIPNCGLLVLSFDLEPLLASLKQKGLLTKLQEKSSCPSSTSSLFSASLRTVPAPSEIFSSFSKDEILQLGRSCFSLTKKVFSFD